MQAFLRDTRGNVALIFALSLLPIAFLVGASVDLSRMRVERTKLQSAVDAAVLAATSMPLTSSDAQIESAVADFMAANYVGVGTISDIDVDRSGSSVEVFTQADIPMSFAALLGADVRPVTAHAQADRGGANVEVTLVLDVTGSMGGDKLEDLQDAADDLIDIVVQDTQTPFYTKMAIVPYSNAVRLGDLADDARGPVVDGIDVGDVTWYDGTVKTVSAITREYHAKVTTSASHGFSNGDEIWFYGVHGMTQLDDYQRDYGPLKVSDRTSRTFRLKDKWGDYVSSSYWSYYSTYYGSGHVAKCHEDDCSLRIKALGHGFSDDDWVVLDGFTGDYDELNGEAVQIDRENSNYFSPVGVYPPGDYDDDGGQAYCTEEGCRFYRFQEPGWWWYDGDWVIREINECVSERVDDEEYTDAAPSTEYVGRVYVPDPDYDDCPEVEVVPLTSSKTALHAAIEDLEAAGGTAGQIGMAWGWYTLSSNFNSFWSGSSNNAAAYDAPEMLKVAVLMTDGEFNTAYCHGARAEDYGGEIACDATNGDPFDQAEELCDGMKDDDIVVFTVGFAVSEWSDEWTFLQDCATDDAHATLASNGAELNAAFQAIGDSIGELRLTR